MRTIFPGVGRSLPLLAGDCYFFVPLLSFERRITLGALLRRPATRTSACDQWSLFTATAIFYPCAREGAALENERLRVRGWMEGCSGWLITQVLLPVGRQRVRNGCALRILWARRRPFRYMQTITHKFAFAHCRVRAHCV